MKKSILTVLFVAGLAMSMPLLAQLAGTERHPENIWMPGDRKISFGPNPNASIQYSGGNLVIDVTSGGGKVSFPDGIDTGTANMSLASSLVFEGATADAFETTLAVVDPTADQTWSIPNFGVDAAFVGSTLTTNRVDAANSIWGISNSLNFEGATADAFETTVTVVDPTADRTVTWPDASGTPLLSTAAQDAANSVKGVANGLEFEGSAADASETTLSVTNPTADRTVTVPDASGTVILGGNTTITSGANTACNTTCGASTRCIAGQDAGASNVLVACNAATADVCICSTN